MGLSLRLGSVSPIATVSGVPGMLRAKPYTSHVITTSVMAPMANRRSM